MYRMRSYEQFACRLGGGPSGLAVVKTQDDAERLAEIGVVLRCSRRPGFLDRRTPGASEDDALRARKRAPYRRSVVRSLLVPVEPTPFSSRSERCPNQ
jgi:hypothetical protein